MKLSIGTPTPIFGSEWELARRADGNAIQEETCLASPSACSAIF
jgi:hypothetical protein